MSHRTMPRAWAALLLLLASVACTTPTPRPARDSLPREIDSTASAFGLDLAREQYAILAALGNTFAREERTGATLATFAAAVNRCISAIPALEQAQPGESDDARRRRHLVLAGCIVLSQNRADAGAVDRVLSLWELALRPADSALPPVVERF